MKWKIGALALSALLAFSTAGRAATVTVTPSSLNGWAFYSTDDNGTLNTGTATANIDPAAPAGGPLPPGAAHLATGPLAGDGSAQARLNTWSGTALADLTDLSYDTYITKWNGQQATYLTLWLDTDGDTAADDRIHFEPDYSSATAGNGNPSPQAAPVLNLWQHWDALNGMWYSDSGLADPPGGTGTPESGAITLSAYLALRGSATIVNAAPGIGGIRVTSGFGTGGPVPPGDDFDAHFDNFKIGTASGSSTYDFEGAAVVPLPATVWMGMTLMVGMSAAQMYKRYTANAVFA